jgi:molybdopterin molybdotransferase
VEVCRRPSLAVLDSGDELAAHPEHCEAHQIPASNGPMLAAMAAPLVTRVKRLGPVPDRMDALAAALEQAEDSDVLVTSGGASVGDHDLVRPALEAWGAQIDFWRVAIKPGKPLLVARRGGQIVLGLPGNPVSSFVTAMLFLIPLLRQLGGSARPVPDALALPLAAALPATGDRMEFVRASFSAKGVAALNQQDSSALASLAAANCLIRRPAGSPAGVRGDMVEVLPFASVGMA